MDLIRPCFQVGFTVQHTDEYFETTRENTKAVITKRGPAEGEEEGQVTYHVSPGRAFVCRSRSLRTEFRETVGPFFFAAISAATRRRFLSASFHLPARKRTSTLFSTLPTHPPSQLFLFREKKKFFAPFFLRGSAGCMRGHNGIKKLKAHVIRAILRQCFTVQHCAGSGGEGGRGRGSVTRPNGCLHSTIGR